MEKKPSLFPSRNLVLATTFIATIASLATMAAQAPSLRIDGVKITSDVPPVTSLKGEAFLPLRAVAEALGAEMSFNPKTGVIRLVRDKDRLLLRVGDRHATFNGSKLTLRHAPFIVRGRTMVGMYAISRAFSSKVSYDRARAKIEVRTPDMVEAGAQQDQ